MYISNPKFEKHNYPAYKFIKNQCQINQNIKNSFFIFGAFWKFVTKPNNWNYENVGLLNLYEDFFDNFN